MTDSVAGCRVAGEARHGPGRLAVTEPASGQTLAVVTAGDGNDVEAAVTVTVATGPEWSSVDIKQRGAALRGIARDLRAEVDPLARLVTRETGKRIAESRAEVGFSADFFDWYADLGHVLVDDHRRHEQRRFVVGRRPLGAVGVLSPWNFPLSIPARKIAPALTAGCTVAFKPSELAPLSGLKLAEIIDRWVPAGVVNTVVGEAEVSAALVADPRLRGVSFTGSTRVGALVAAACAPRFTRLVLELGGRAPFIVLDDAGLDDAVEALLVAKYRNNGASCIAANDVFVHESLYEDFVACFVERSLRLRVGDPLEEATDLGPVIAPEAAERLAALARSATAQGLTTWQGADVPDSGSFVPPVVVAEPDHDGPWATEIFGPITPVRRFADESALLALVNDWPQGLGGYVCSASSERALQLAEQLEVGIVGINNGAPNTVEVPFGGFKTSGIAREGGVAGLDPFLEYQTMSIAT